MSGAQLHLLPAGSELARWLSARRAPDRVSRAYRLLYRWRGAWFDRAWALQRDRIGAGAAQEALAAPIWIVGFWRSGTTYLHQLLARHPSVCYPRTWQCFNPAGLLQAPPSRSRSESRPMDSIEVTAFSPQEDEFALMALGHPSVYRGFLAPDALIDCATALDGNYWRDDEGWAADLRIFLAGCSGGRHRWVLKSPNHLFRIPGIQRWFPGSHLLWILRDPLQVWTSNRRMWRAMAARYSLWNWREGDIDAFLSLALRRYAEILQHWLEDGSPVTAISLEELQADPQGVLERLFTQVGLEPGDEWREAASSVPRGAEPEPPPDEATAELLATLRGLQARLLAPR